MQLHFRNQIIEMIIGYIFVCKDLCSKDCDTEPGIYEDHK